MSNRIAKPGAVIVMFGLVLFLPVIGFIREHSVESGDDLIFIHHSVGQNWLNGGLDDALTNKAYVDERNDIYYGTDVAPDAGRPDSLAPVPGDLTDMHHWILWFNDYLTAIETHGALTGRNRIVMFKSCYPNSNIVADGTEPGDPFSSLKYLANYRAVYRHPAGPGNVYDHNGYGYLPLEDIFAAHPEILFIVVTAPPLHYAPWDATTDPNAHRARLFNDWLKGEWLSAYNTAHPGLDNVAVFDLFDFLAYPDDHLEHPNRLRAEYGGESGDSHPNAAANSEATIAFASGSDNFIDPVYHQYIEAVDVEVAIKNDQDVYLSWTAPAALNLNSYQLWHSNQPYLEADPGTAMELTSGAMVDYEHQNVIGDGQNGFYLLVGFDSAGLFFFSRRVGEFEFPLG